MNDRRELVRASSAVKTVSTEASQSLEQARERRRQELGDWQPSNGWLINAAAVQRLQKTRSSRH
jgi:hypothetical protein